MGRQQDDSNQFAQRNISIMKSNRFVKLILGVAAVLFILCYFGKTESVFAEDIVAVVSSAEELISKFGNSSGNNITIVINQDVTLNSDIDFSTAKYAGKTITIKASGNRTMLFNGQISMKNGKDVTLKLGDGSKSGTDVLNIKGIYKYTVSEDGLVTYNIDGKSVPATYFREYKNSYFSCGFENRGTMELYDGVVISDFLGRDYMTECVISNYNTFRMYGGTITHCSCGTENWNKDWPRTIHSNTALYGIIINKPEKSDDEVVTCDIKGGLFEKNASIFPMVGGVGKNTKITVSGGTFNGDVKSEPEFPFVSRSSEYCGVTVINGASIEMSGGLINDFHKGINTDNMSYGVNTKVVFSGGKIRGTIRTQEEEQSRVTSMAYAIFLKGGCDFSMSGGEIMNCSSGIASDFNPFYENNQKLNYKITGGTIEDCGIGLNCNYLFDIDDVFFDENSIISEYDVENITIKNCNLGISFADKKITFGGTSLIENCKKGILVDCYKSTFIMNGGTIRKCDSSGLEHYNGFYLTCYDYGGGISNAGTFILNDGLIENNRGYYGGNIFNKGYNEKVVGTFIMNGGIVKDGIALGGGGIINSAALEINGGVIEENYSDEGAGIYQYNAFKLYSGKAEKISLKMEGGSIERNNANKSYAGVFIEEGSANFIKGSVKDNVAPLLPGIYYLKDAKVTIGKDFIMEPNKIGTPDTKYEVPDDVDPEEFKKIIKKVKFKQDVTVNLFDKESVGTFHFTPVVNNLVSVSVKDADSIPFTITFDNENNVGYIKQKDSIPLKADGTVNKSKVKTKGVLLLKFSQSAETFEIPFTIKIANTKPNVVLTDATLSINPSFGLNSACFDFKDKKSGELEDSSLYTVSSLKDGISVTKTEDNHFKVDYSGNKNTSFKISVKKDSWRTSLKYSVKINVKEPKAGLSVKKVNINEYNYDFSQKLETKALVVGNRDAVITKVDITGGNKNTEAALNSGFLSVSSNNLGDISVGLKNKLGKAANYSLKITPYLTTAEGEKVLKPVTLSISVINKKPTISVAGPTSIEGFKVNATYTYTVSVANSTSKIKDVKWISLYKDTHDKHFEFIYAGGNSYKLKYYGPIGLTGSTQYPYKVVVLLEDGTSIEKTGTIGIELSMERGRQN